MISQIRRNAIFFQSILAVLFIFVAGSIIYFWNQGYVDGKKITELHLVNSRLNELNNNNQYKNIKTLVAQGEITKAVKELENISFELKNIAYKTDFNTFQPLLSVLKKLNNDLVKMEGLPSENKIVQNLENKISKFHQFATTNRYQTLMRTSDRMLNELKNRSDFNQLVKSLRTDSDLIIDIVSKSSLTNDKKHEIFKKIENFDDEYKMLKDFSFQKVKLDKGISKASSETELWFKVIGPLLSEEKLRAEQIGRYYMIAYLTLLALISISIFLGIAFTNYSRKKEQKNLEKFTNEVINQYLLGKESFRNKGLSAELQDSLTKGQSYLNKRMSFGHIFQNTLPFPALMLDNNLRVIWYNKNFSQTWSIPEEEISSDTLTWDYLAKMTNLGDEDPVLESIRTRVGGIYQIKVSGENQQHHSPFEMYITPVEIENEKRMMIYFYPLQVMQETITDQGETLIKPIKASINLLISKKSDELKNLKQEFDKLGISDLYAKFRELNEVYKAEINILLNELSAKDSIYSELKGFANHVQDINSKNISNNMEIVKGMKDIKDIVIGAFEVNSTIYSQAKDLEFLNENVVDKLENSINLNKNLYEFYSEVGTSLPQLENLKFEYRRIKMELLDKRSSLSLSLSQLVHIKKKLVDTDSIERFSIQYEKVITDFRAIDELISQLDKKLMSTEVLTSKLLMLAEERKDSIQSSSVVINSEMIKDYKSASAKIYSQINQSQMNSSKEDQLVNVLKSVFVATKDNIANARAIEKQNGLNARNIDLN